MTETEVAMTGRDFAAVMALPAQVDHPGTRMARMAMRPTWAGVLDFQTRFPGGGAAENFQREGQS